jgi:hypothetical protein
MLQALENFCDRWKLEGNIEKIKITIFRKRGATRRAERWYITRDREIRGCS